MNDISHEVLNLNTPEHVVEQRRERIKGAVNNLFISLGNMGVKINHQPLAESSAMEKMPLSVEVSDYAAQRMVETAPAAKSVQMSPEVAAYTEQMQQDRENAELERIREEIERNYA